MPASSPILPASLFLGIDRSGPVPLYFQVAERIEAAIDSGELPAGARLENEIALAEQLRLSRPTIRRAIQTLVDKGLLVRRRGIGTQVVHGQVRRNVELTSLFEDLQKSHRAPTTLVAGIEEQEASAVVAEQLGLPLGSKVLYVKRVRMAEGVPVAILVNYLPPAFLDFSADDFTQFGLYQLFRARGVSIQVARQRISARNASADEARLLTIPENGALLTMDRTAYDSSGKAVEFGHHCYRPDLYTIETTVVDR